MVCPVVLAEMVDECKQYIPRTNKIADKSGGTFIGIVVIYSCLGFFPLPW